MVQTKLHHIMLVQRFTGAVCSHVDVIIGVELLITPCIAV